MLFCGNCGTKTEENVRFCQNCGVAKIGISKDTAAISLNQKTSSSYPITVLAKDLPKILFHGEDWLRARVFVVSSYPNLDILITEDYFYLIKFPPMHSGTWGFVLGLLLGQFVGAIIGSYLGNSSDRKKRRKIRATWFDPDYKLISRDYENTTFLKIPRAELKNGIIFKNKKIVTIAYNGISIHLKKNKEAVAEMRSYIGV